MVVHPEDYQGEDGIFGLSLWVTNFCYNRHLYNFHEPMCVLDMWPTSKEWPSTATPRPIVLGWLTIQLLRSTGRALSSTAGAGGHHHNHHRHHHHHHCCNRHVWVTDSPSQRPPVPFLEPLYCCQCGKGELSLPLLTFQWIVIPCDMYSWSSNTNNDV